MKSKSRNSYRYLSEEWKRELYYVYKPETCANGNRKLAYDMIKLDSQLRAAENKKMRLKLQGIPCDQGGVVKALLLQAITSPGAESPYKLGEFYHFGLKIPEISGIIERQIERGKFVLVAQEVLNPNCFNIS